MNEERNGLAKKDGQEIKNGRRGVQLQDGALLLLLLDGLGPGIQDRTAEC